MAKAEAKELVQALAFAHFAVYPNASQEDHEQKFLDLFDPSVKIPPSIQTKYKSYLSQGFPFNDLTRRTVGKSNYIKKPNPKIQDPSPKDNSTVKIVYSVAKEVYSKNVLKKPWSSYVFLDQNDDFVMKIKDETLAKIIKALSLNIKPDILSSADIFAVNSAMKEKIQKEIVDNHETTDIILANMASGENTVRTITNKYFNSRDLIPISLKLPDTMGGTRHVSIVGRTTGKYAEPVVNDNIIDPYTKFIALVMNKKNNTKQLIDDLITIHFNKFKISSSRLNWEFPVTFNYDKVYGKDASGKVNNNPISTMSYGFDLFAQGYGAGFNGQFTSGKTGGQWVGGAGIETFEQFFDQYTMYSTIINEVAKMRLASFHYSLTGSTNKTPSFGNNKELKSLYNAAVSEIKQPHILSGPKRQKAIMKFFDEYDNVNNKMPKQAEKVIKKKKTLYDVSYSYFRYLAHFVMSTKKSMKGVTDTVFHQFLVGKGAEAKAATSAQKLERLKAHYVHAQCSWFLMRGGTGLNLYLKKRMFLTIFGVITKKGYMIFEGATNTQMKSALSKEFQMNGKKLVADFATIPHLYLS
jgi:hypothetical protein